MKLTLNAISGEITTVSPGAIRAGNWKVRDFPPPEGFQIQYRILPLYSPVGITQMMSLPSRDALQMLIT